MPFYPTLAEGYTQRLVTDAFAGYNHRLKINDGEFYNTHNLTTDYYPMLANRKPRSATDIVQTEPQGIIAKDSLAYIDNGTLYYNHTATGVTGLTPGEKKLVSMGAYIIIFPDKVYYNTEKANDYGSMEASFSYSGQVSYQLCDMDGKVYPEQSQTKPAEPNDGELWIDTDNKELKKYSASNGVWISIPQVYTKITFDTVMTELKGFSDYDGVQISGMNYADLNGSKILYKVGNDGTTANYVVTVGILDEKLMQIPHADITIKRQVPAMDYVCECQNRLWGCFFGNDGTQNLNEIYCCTLGDFKNWEQYLGVSTDSWRASVGSDGKWTGAINFLGYPTFFKEDRIHTVSVSAYGAHQIADTPARGVQDGSSKSLQVVNETLYYKSRTDVCAYQGGFPESVSAALGDEKYYKAVSGSFGDKYYISMADSEGKRHFFCFDIGKGLWMEEDELDAVQFARLDDSLYCLTADGSIVDINGSDGETEDVTDWSAETGIIGYEYPDKKYISRFNIRLKMGKGASAELYLEYDSSGVWERNGTIRLRNVGTVTLPVRPRRCDHMRLKLAGHGEVRVFSIAKLLEQGSDM